MKDFGNCGTQVPVIGQGTWEVGDHTTDARSEIEALRTGLDLGLTHIDTAEMYGNGRSERLGGQAIEGRRQEVFLVSKVLPSHGAYLDTIRACEASLRLLNTDYVRENAGALGWSLLREDLALLDEAFPPPVKEVPLDMI